jgi:hypothetical protein
MRIYIERYLILISLTQKLDIILQTLLFDPKSRLAGGRREIIDW